VYMAELYSHLHEFYARSDVSAPIQSPTLLGIFSILT